MEVVDRKEIVFKYFKEIPIGEVFTRESGLAYLKINGVAAFNLGGTTTTDIDPKEVVILRDAKIVLE